MSIEQRIEDVIEAGWGVLDSYFDPIAFQRWRRRAFDCLTAVVGPDHVYTRHLANFVQQGIVGNELDSVRSDESPQSSSALIEKNGGGAGIVRI